MTKQVPWNKVILETFIADAMLTKDEEIIMRTRVAGWTRKEQAQKLNMDVSTIDYHIKILKQKYDEAQKYNPLLPPRKNTSAEIYLDEN